MVINIWNCKSLKLISKSIICLFFLSGKGDSFGENFAIDPSKPVVNSNTSIRALTYCEMRTISREDVLYILNQYPLFRENFIKDLEITYNLRGGDIKQVSFQTKSFTFSRYFVFVCLFVCLFYVCVGVFSCDRVGSLTQTGFELVILEATASPVFPS